MREYISTRGGNEKLRSAQAIIQGLAKDRGLFVPNEIPHIDLNADFTKPYKYRDIAEYVINLFFDDFSASEIKKCVDNAYDEKFEKEEIVPVQKHCGAFFIELYHGRTAAFKDMALSILPYLLTESMKKEKEMKKVCILTATSGDTGKAALEGFRDVEGTEIIVFFPENGVSEIQKRQMVSQEGKNVHVFAIKGNFDDAQTGVKKVFDDAEFNKYMNDNGYRLSSANSINVGRLIPQVAYYVYAYLKLIESSEIKNGESVNVVVPTGNFGNILAAYYAKIMGVPFKKFICASNENRVLTDFINTGLYDINRDFHVTNSPSMDILISSNLERLLFEISGRDGEIVKKMMGSLSSERKYEITNQMRDKIRDFYGGFATENETIDTIKKVYEDENYMIDTHTAVAYKVYDDYRNETGDETKTLIASTASVYKFASSFAEALGMNKQKDPFMYIDEINDFTGENEPRALQGLRNRAVLHNDVIEKESMKRAIRKVVAERK